MPRSEDGKNKVDIDNVAINQVHAYNRITDKPSQDRGYGVNKHMLPKGSITFQQVLEEIEKEKQAERQMIEKTLNAFTSMKKKSSVNKNGKTNRWRMITMKIKSQKT